VSVRAVIVIGVVLVLLFIASVVLNACNANTIDSSSQKSSTASVQERFDGLLAKPLAAAEVRETTPCLLQPTGCPIGPNQSRTVLVLQSGDAVRRVRRATFALLQQGSTPGASLKVSFTPVRDDPANGEVRSDAQPGPTPRPTQPPERSRVSLNISQDGGQLTITCQPATATCVAKLVPD
jgi:hypothetical protein